MLIERCRDPWNGPKSLPYVPALYTELHTVVMCVKGE